MPRQWMTRRNLIVALVFIAGFPVAIALELVIGAVVSKWSDQSGDFSLDSYATYAVGDIIDTTPKGLLANPGRYARKLVEIRHIEAKTLVIDGHVGDLQGSIQYAAYSANQPADQILLVDENSYVTPDCTSSTVGCPRFLGDRMQFERVAAVAPYDKIQGRWLPIDKYPIPRLSRQPAYPYALWVAKAWVPGAIGPR